MKIFEVKNHVPLYSWMGMETPDEWETIESQKKICLFPQVYHHVALMADGHQGKGPNVGSVIALKNAVSPAAVGVDVFCGVLAVKYNITAEDLPESLLDIRLKMEEAIPVGFNSYKNIPKLVKLNQNLWNRFNSLDFSVAKLKDKSLHQCGTLGGGNHFLCLNLDNDGNLWVMLHSGSINIGKELAEKHITIAKQQTYNKDLFDPNYAVLLANTPEFQSYYNDILWLGDFAALSRRIMLEAIHNILVKTFPLKNVEQISDVIQANHNYLARETHFGEEVYITRKGAISAKLNELGIIPGSQTSKSYIVKGLGNPDSFMSASHGAGRRMSRGKAKKEFTLDDLKNSATKNLTIRNRTFNHVECRTDRGVLDEIEYAYKSIETIMDNQKDLVEILVELSPILTVKG